jgi:hypothetical protein
MSVDLDEPATLPESSVVILVADDEGTTSLSRNGKPSTRQWTALHLSNIVT